MKNKNLLLDLLLTVVYAMTAVLNALRDDKILCILWSTIAGLQGTKMLLDVIRPEIDDEEKDRIEA